jgi:RNA polymerase sigma factor (sigma-70 family)
MTPEQKALVEANIGLAPTFARRYYAQNMEFCDLVQEAYLGLIKAAETYDSSRGSFSTWAAWMIKNSVLDAIDSRDDMIRTPRRQDSIECGSLDPETEILSEQETVEEIVDREACRENVQECIKELSFREAVVLRLRHGINTPKRTLAQTAPIVGVVPERVRQIQMAAEKKLRLLLIGVTLEKPNGGRNGEQEKDE